jgi:hypothetical protein
MDFDWEPEYDELTDRFMKQHYGGRSLAVAFPCMRKSYPPTGLHEFPSRGTRHCFWRAHGRRLPRRWSTSWIGRRERSPMQKTIELRHTDVASLELKDLRSMDMASYHRISALQATTPPLIE